MAVYLVISRRDLHPPHLRAIDRYVRWIRDLYCRGRVVDNIVHSMRRVAVMADADYLPSPARPRSRRVFAFRSHDLGEDISTRTAEELRV